jgi:hypothetical protein
LLDLADGRLRAASNDKSKARRLLEKVLSSAKKYGFKGFELEAQLSLGEIAIKDGSPNAIPQLRSLQAEAERSEFRLIAKKAGAILAGAH